MKEKSKGDITISLAGKLNGREINLENITIKEVRNLLDIAQPIFSLPEDSNNSKNKNNIPIKIKSGSVIIQANSPSVVKILQPDINIVKQYNDTVYVKNAKSQKIINSIIEKYGSSDLSVTISAVNYDGIESKITIDKNHNIKNTTKPILVKSEDYIYGAIYDAGGMEPNIHMETSSGEKIKIATTKKDIASIDGNFLYKPSGIHVEFDENIHTGERSNYKFIKIIRYNPRPTKEEMEDFFSFQKREWSKIKDIDKKLKELS